MCRNASFFLLRRLKGSMSGDARDFNNMRRKLSSPPLPPQGKAPKEMYAILTETLGDMHHRVPPSQLGGPV
jgi:hypothetical protein